MVVRTRRKHTTITIPVTLFELLKDQMKMTGFASVSAYATYLLRETIIELIEEEARKGTAGKDRDAILERLRRLGYLVH